MNKMRKKLSMVVLGVVLVMALSVTAFASSAWDSFSTKLPANQGDTERQQWIHSCPCVGRGFLGRKLLRSLLGTRRWKQLECLLLFQ